MLAVWDDWVSQATRKLSAESKATVRTEIEAHFEMSREAAMARGLDEAQAEREALAALGDPREANRQYRLTLLTSSEARVLRKTGHEAACVMSNAYLKWTLRLAPLAVGITALAILRNGDKDLAQDLGVAAAAMAVLLLGPMLPVYTRSRGLVYRTVKWLALAVLCVAAFGGTSRQGWLAFVVLWPIMHTEWIRASIRRKLPQARWPKQLYL